MVLAILADGPLHGYAVIEALRQRSDAAFDLPEGTMYPVLHRLESAGLLSSSWQIEGGRRRRTYSLTDRGRGALDTERAAWNEFARAVTRVVRGPAWNAI
jgi:PadR family transcriptional regulator, regulatory protein PadR